jgi:hypothetical protein
MPQIPETGKFVAMIFRLSSISYVVLPSARVELRNRLSGGTGPLLKEETVKMFRVWNILVHPTLKVEFKFKAKKYSCMTESGCEAGTGSAIEREAGSGSALK